MAEAERCIYCHSKLRADGYCGNKNCIDYLSTLIHDDEERLKKERIEHGKH